MTRRANAGAATALTATVFAIDQICKSKVRAEIGFGYRIQVLGPLDLVHTENTGIAFGLLAGGGVGLVILAAVAIVMLAGFFVFHSHRRGIWLPTGLLLGGALGNLYDRASAAAVTDFIKVPYWPAFNLADVGITLGVIALLWLMSRPQSA